MMGGKKGSELFTMARELSIPLAPCGIAILSAAGAMFGLPPPRRPHCDETPIDTATMASGYGLAGGTY
jgi:hypothetical protein